MSGDGPLIAGHAMMFHPASVMTRRTLVLLLLAALQPSLPARGPAPAVRLRFAAVVGDAPLRCGVEYRDIGTSKSTITLTDFRFYVSRVRLLTADGGERPVTLDQDGLWQAEDVALLDFEDGTGGCANGTEPTRDVVEGEAAAGPYTGVRFDVGLPFEINHRDPTLQPSPLNLTRMFWSWNAGYKFLRLDLRTAGQPNGWGVHLGSMACTPNDRASAAPVSCAQPNLVPVELRDFDPSRDAITIDIARLLAASDVDRNTPGTGGGCESGIGDPECAPIFSQLGLAGAPQSVFRVRPQASPSASSP
jgi:uncharacterized repeat protein (TIGR04052 family)